MYADPSWTAAGDDSPTDCKTDCEIGSQSKGTFLIRRLPAPALACAHSHSDLEVELARIDWSGVFVVSVTPFKEDGAFDEAATRTLIDTLIEDGVNGIVLAGSTGEWFTMSDEERIELFRVAKDQAKGRVPLLAGISAIAGRT